MRGPPPLSGPWSPTVIYRSPTHLNAVHQSQHSQSYHDVRATNRNYPLPSPLNEASELPGFGDYWSLNNLASVGMAAPTSSTTTSAAPPSHVQYIDISHTHRPQDSMNIQFPAQTSSFEPASAPGSATQCVPPKPAPMPEQNTQILLDNGSNLEKMRHEHLDQARCDTGSSAPSSKAWEDAWEALREQMTKM
ncbi:hypothetical protein E4T48_05425 [Aureobasidium sp. EXF-10727]|nr:hypothetical protein E4T48_05425 [Aureobasidium sp. EXF-10727]